MADFLKKVIDVSTFQGEIDWETVKSKSDVDYVIIRAGYGKTTNAAKRYVDKWFIRNITECNRLGIPCGVYWFSYAVSEAEAIEEAEFCLDIIKGYKIELPVAFDFEYDSVTKAAKKGVTITKVLATNICKAFCSTIEKAGYFSMVYANGDYLSRYFDATIPKLYSLWYAAWPTKKVDIKVDRPSRSCGIWQYGGSKIPGIQAGVVDVDSNACYTDYITLIRKNKMNHLEEYEAAQKTEEQKLAEELAKKKAAEEAAKKAAEEAAKKAAEEAAKQTNNEEARKIMAEIQLNAAVEGAVKRIRSAPGGDEVLLKISAMLR